MRISGEKMTGLNELCADLDRPVSDVEAKLFGLQSKDVPLGEPQQGWDTYSPAEKRLLKGKVIELSAYERTVEESRILPTIGVELTLPSST